MKPSPRIRALSVSVGLVLGMTATVFAPHLVHAATPHKAAKPSFTERVLNLPEATAEQLQAAERVLVGGYECDMGRRISVDRDASHNGYFNMTVGKQSWLMKPVLSSTGAVRLEDVKGAALLIQILTKSMVMDTKQGRRLVDGCRQASQRAAEDNLRAHPQPSAFGLKGDAGY
jgi:hypothetical protein